VAIGEGFGDYFAASFFAARKPERLRDGVMSWDALEESDADPPVLRRMTERRTYRAFRPRGDEHDNGSIWAATLWEVWRKFGRVVADRIVIESHFQLDGFTTFARAARAIIDADRNLYRGVLPTRFPEEPLSSLARQPKKARLTCSESRGKYPIFMRLG
jgi:hypothetical protein